LTRTTEAERTPTFNPPIGCLHAFSASDHLNNKRKSLDLLKQDLRAMIFILCECVFFVVVLGYIAPELLSFLDMALSFPLVFFGLYGNMAYHYYRKNRRREYRLKRGWIVWGDCYL